MKSPLLWFGDHMKKLDVIQRGYDSSGRPVKATRQAFQHFDRVNEAVKGKLVIVQGAFMTNGASASAGTHDKAGCMDIRTWNLTSFEKRTAVHEARRLMAAAWLRTPSQGFDEHIHWVLIGDSPMANLAASQIDMYKQGYNGLGWYAYRDSDSYRPQRITNYVYQEDDDMFSDKDSARLERIEKELTAFKNAEWKRDKNARIQDKERFSKLVSNLGMAVDVLNSIEAQIEDSATKQHVQHAKRRIIDVLREDEDVDGVDNPAPTEE